MQGALLYRLVDPRDEGPVLLGDRRGVPVGDRLLEAAEMRFDRAGEATVLVVLAGGS